MGAFAFQDPPSFLLLPVCLFFCLSGAEAPRLTGLRGGAGDVKPAAGRLHCPAAGGAGRLPLRSPPPRATAAPAPAQAQAHLVDAPVRSGAIPAVRRHPAGARPRRPRPHRARGHGPGSAAASAGPGPGPGEGGSRPRRGCRPPPPPRLTRAGSAAGAVTHCQRLPGALRPGTGASGPAAPLTAPPPAPLGRAPAVGAGRAPPPGLPL